MIAIGYYIGAALMIGGGVVEALLGVKAERRSLENVAAPLTAESPGEGGGKETGGVGSQPADASRLPLA